MHDDQTSNNTDQTREHKPSDRSVLPIGPDEKLLVAYLDQELDEEAATSLEKRLTREPALRNKLHDLQQTWDMLDELPQARAGQTFVKTTIEMVVARTKRKRRTWYRWPVRIAAILCVFSLTTIAAFDIVRYRQNQPYRQFVLDLDVIRNLDRYEKIQNIEFLEQLRDNQLFTEDVSDE